MINLSSTRQHQPVVIITDPDEIAIRRGYTVEAYLRPRHKRRHSEDFDYYWARPTEDQQWLDAYDPVHSEYVRIKRSGHTIHFNRAHNAAWGTVPDGTSERGIPEVETVSQPVALLEYKPLPVESPDIPVAFEGEQS